MTAITKAIASKTNTTISPSNPCPAFWHQGHPGTRKGKPDTNQSKSPKCPGVWIVDGHLDESPEDPGKHHHHKEHYNLRSKIVLQKGCRYFLLIVIFTTTRHSYLWVFHNLPKICQDLFSGLLEVQSEKKMLSSSTWQLSSIMLSSWSQLEINHLTKRMRKAAKSFKPR